MLAVFVNAVIVGFFKKKFKNILKNIFFLFLKIIFDISISKQY
jgi:hypothetical protein